MSTPEPDWQIQVNGQEYGPYARTRILDMLARRELPDAAAVRQQGMPEWLPVPAARRLLEAAAAEQAPRPPEPAAQEEGEDGGSGEGHGDGGDDAVEFSASGAPPAGPACASPSSAPGAPAPAAGVEGAAPPLRRSKAPFLYAGIAVLVLVLAWWAFGGGAPSGQAGYNKVKAELVDRMDAWRDRRIRLESIPASAVDGPLVRYRIDPPARPVGEKESEYVFVVHCVFRDAHGRESEAQATVTMGVKRLRFWDLFSK